MSLVSAYFSLFLIFGDFPQNSDDPFLRRDTKDWIRCSGGREMGVQGWGCTKERANRFVVKTPKLSVVTCYFFFPFRTVLENSFLENSPWISCPAGSQTPLDKEGKQWFEPPVSSTLPTNLFSVPACPLLLKVLKGRNA